MRRILLAQLSTNGDTIVEVMLAMALLTLVLVSAWSLTNRTTQFNLASRKRIDMVNELKQQAEIIRAHRDRGTSAQFITDFGGGNASAVPSDPCSFTNPGFPGGAPLGGTAYSYGDTGGLGTAVKLVAGDAGTKVWFQVSPQENDASGVGQYIDFYIRGCWQTFGGFQKTDSSQILMRLNI